MKPIKINPQHYRKISLLLLLGAILITAGCQASPTPALPPPPSGPLIRVAILTPSLGELAPFGRMMLNGSTMAFEEWNNRSGVLDHRIEWVIYDSACQFGPAQQAIRRAIEDGIKFMVGPLCSEAAIAAAEVAESAKVLMISPTATHPLVTTNSRGQTRPTVFRASHSYLTQGQATAEFARETVKAGTAAIFFNPGDSYARTLADAFAQQFTEQGGEIVYRATYAPGHSTDFSEQLAAIRESGAAVIYLPAPVQVVNQFSGQLQTAEQSSASPSPESRPILLGSDSWDAAELDLTATTGSYFFTHFAVTDANPISQSWAEAYKSTYAIEPDTLAALGYDAAQLLLAAIQQAGTLDPDAAAKALEQGTFKGVTGEIKFNRNHDPIKPATIIHVEKGQKVLFYP